jgi:hypothetical protein
MLIDCVTQVNSWNLKGHTIILLYCHLTPLLYAHDNAISCVCDVWGHVTDVCIYTIILTIGLVYNNITGGYGYDALSSSL